MNQLRLGADEALLYRLHRPPCALWIARAAQDRPALRQGIDLAFQIALRAEWFAIIEVSASVPLAVPAVLLDVFLQLPRLGYALAGKVDFIALPRQFGKPHQHVVKKESQPDTFTPSFFSDQIHSVIPVTAPNQRQAMGAESQPMFDRAHAMFVHRA